MFAIHVSSLLKCPSLLPILKLGCFLITGFEGSFSILYRSPLSDLCFANVFSQSFVCLFSLLTVFDFDAHKHVNSWVIFLVSYLKIFFPNPNLQRFPSVFL